MQKSSASAKLFCRGGEQFRETALGPWRRTGYALGMLPNRYRGPPMTLGNMRANGVRSLTVSCLICHHRAVLAVDTWPDHVPVPSFGPRMVCTSCGIIGADARPNWSERPVRPSLTGGQWR